MSLSIDQIKNIIAFVIVLFWLIMALTSCSPEKRARRLLKHAAKDIRKAKLLDPMSVPDVEVRTDTVYLTDIKKDTIVKFEENVRDTIIFKDKTVVRYRVRTDTIEIEVDCPDQIVVTDSIFVPRPITTEPTTIQSLKKLWWLPSILLIILLYAVLRRKNG